MGRQLRSTHPSVVAFVYRKILELTVDWDTLQCVTKGFSTGLYFKETVKEEGAWLSGKCQSETIQFARQYVFL